jgi:hypothetical protein
MEQIMSPLTATPFLTDSQVRWVVEQAARAPSVHNTQPWRFRWDGHAFDLVADLRRGLVVSDPDGRELVISCGAALFNLRLALRKLEARANVAAFPDRLDARWLARIAIEAGPPVDDVERGLLAALSRRHTHRGPFTRRKITPGLAVRLQQAAETQGGRLLYINDPGPRRQILHLTRAAERLRSASDRVRDETAHWTPSPDMARRDGVPARAYPPGPPAAGRDDLAGRDFDLSRNIGLGESAEQPPAAIAVLVTDHDLAPDWLQAGQALESVLLTAASEWAFAGVHTRVCEVPPLRAELRRGLGTAAHPQVVLRFGYAHTSPVTPRRPPEEVMDVSL